jgi:hypothetical protein
MFMFFLLKRGIEGNINNAKICKINKNIAKICKEKITPPSR